MLENAAREGNAGIAQFEDSVFSGHYITGDIDEKYLANLEKLAAAIPVPSYAIDDQTAIKVVDDTVEVVSEGQWKLFTPSPDAS